MSTLQANTNQSGIQQELAKLRTTTSPYYVELSLEALDEQGSTLDALIQYTFEQLNVQHLDLRIVAEAN